MSSIIKVDAIQKADGTTPTAGDLGLNTTGSVLQVVNVTNKDTASFSGGTWGAWPITASITPTSTSSKILIMAHLPNNYVGGGGQDWYVQLRRDGTNLFGSTGNSSVGGSAEFSNQLNCAGFRKAINIQHLDSPATTSQITYDCRARNTTGVTMYLNYPSERGDLSITLMEIAG